MEIIIFFLILIVALGVGLLAAGAMIALIVMVWIAIIKAIVGHSAKKNAEEMARMQWKMQQQQALNNPNSSTSYPRK